MPERSINNEYYSDFDREGVAKQDRNWLVIVIRNLNLILVIKEHKRKDKKKRRLTKKKKFPRDNLSGSKVSIPTNKKKKDKFLYFEMV